MGWDQFSTACQDYSKEDMQTFMQAYEFAEQELQGKMAKRQPLRPYIFLTRMDTKASVEEAPSRPSGMEDTLSASLSITERQRAAKTVPRIKLLGFCNEF